MGESSTSINANCNLPYRFAGVYTIFSVAEVIPYKHNW